VTGSVAWRVNNRNIKLNCLFGCLSDLKCFCRLCVLLLFVHSLAYLGEWSLCLV